MSPGQPQQIHDLEQLLEDTVRLISQEFGIYHAGIFLVDERNEYAILSAASSEGGKRMLARNHKLAIGKVGIVGHVARSGKPRIALDVGEDAIFFDNPDLPLTRSEMALPLNLREQTIGVLDVQSTESGAFGEGDISILQTLADQLASYIAYQGLSLFLANVVAVIVFVGMWLCGLSSITSMSRMWFAFGRDGGMPFSRVFSDIHPRWRTPVKSIVVTTILAILLTIYSAAYFVVTSISTIALYIAYNTPTFLNVRNKLRKKGEYTTKEKSPWFLKGWGPVINIIAVVYTVLICIIFMLPPNELVLWTMVTFGVVLVIYWFAWSRSHFKHHPRRPRERNHWTRGPPRRGAARRTSARCP